MKTSLQLREEIGELCNRVDAIVDLARAEKRDLSAEETAEVDRIQGKGKPGETGHAAGEIDKLQAQLERSEKIEARQAQFAAERENGRPTARTGAVLDVQHGEPTGDAGGRPQARGEPAELAGAGVRVTARAARLVIPAQCRFKHSELKAFSGPKADERAFIAGMFFLATLCKNDWAAKWCKEQGINTRPQNALQETGNELGGYLVPDEMETAIIELRQRYGVFRREAKPVPMKGDTKSVPRRTQGVTAYFVGENSLGVQSDKAWDQVKLIAKKLMAITLYSTELAEDAVINIGDDLTDEISYAFSLKEDQCGFLGDGTSTYGGIVGVVNALTSNSVVTAAAGHTALDTLTLSDFQAVVGQSPNYVMQPKWYCHQAVWATAMMRLIDAAGGNTAQWVSTGVPEQGGYHEFLGYPVVIAQVLPKALAASPNTQFAYFGDLELAAAMGSRRGVTIQISDDRYFEYDQIGIKGTERFDINVHERGDSTNGAGALIAIETPAS